MELLYEGDYAPPRRLKCPNKKPSTRCGILPLDLLIRKSHRGPQTMQVLDLFSVIHQFDGKTLLLKTPWILVTT